MSIAPEALRESAKVWECLGPISNGGTVFGLAISPVADVPRHWAATGCGVFYSDDGGETWTQTLNGLTTPLLSAMAVAPNGALFAGALGGELFASWDYGKTWEPSLVPEELKSTVTFLLPSPNFQADGTTFAATDGGGLLVSRNSANSWEDSSFGLGDATVLALAASPDWSSRELMFAATTEGVFVSRNGGRAWRETELLMDDDVVDVLVVSPGYESDRTVFAGTEGGSLYRSSNGGRTWELVQSELVDGPINCILLASDYVDSGRLLAGVANKIYASTDRGETCSVVAELPSSVLALVGDEKVVLAGLHDAGIWRSTDSGETWADSSSGLAARGFARFLPAGSTIYAMGPQEGLWWSEDAGKSWQSVPDATQYLPLTAISVPSGESLFIVSQEQGLLRSTDKGQSWHVVCKETSLQAVLVLTDGGNGWAGTSDGRLFVTRDSGETWEQVDSPCEGQEILTIAASPGHAQDSTLFMGTSVSATGNKQARVALWRSTNSGGTWRQLTTQVTPARWVDIAMPGNGVENAAEQAVLVTGPYCLRPLRRAKDVWISTRVDPNGSNALGVIALGEIDHGGLLFAATGSGVYRSIDGGRTWQPFSAGLSSTSFISLLARCEQERDTLYALSLGGLIWKRELE